METRSLKTPPLLLGTALLFWGWQSGLLLPAIALALACEAVWIISARWEFSQADLDRIWNLTTFLFLGAIALAFFGGDNFAAVDATAGAAARRNDALTRSSRSVLIWFQWLPLAFAPIMLAQIWGRTTEMPFSTFSWFLRQQRAARGARAEPGLNLSFPYLGAVLLAASASNRKGWFFIGLTVLLIWTLWCVRSKRYRWMAWSATMVLVVAGGYGGYLGLRQFQGVLEDVDTFLLNRFGRSNLEFKETRTSLGALGRLKLSGRILLRVEPEGASVPELLREASYTIFKTPLWYNTAARREFQNVYPEDDDATFVLLPRKLSRKSVSVWSYLDHNAGLLPVPNGVSQLEIPQALSVSTNHLGAIKVMGPGLVNYRARYDEGQGIDGPPVAEDLELALEEPDTNAVAQVISELGLKGRPADEVLPAVAAFFRRDFTYSTWLSGAQAGATNRTPLAAFLLEKRTGHCEYFATATVLLLRQAGVPARYAIGYAVQERSGDGYIVRARHAHAWCLAWVNGTWHDFDTTPPDWSEQEQSLASFFEPLRDFSSRVWFEFSKWRWNATGLRPYILLAIVPPIGLLLFRVFFRRQWNRFRRKGDAASTAPAWPGEDSEFYLVAQKLTDQGHPRLAFESATAWLRRLEKAAPGETAELRELLRLHNRLRFDPVGLAAEERLDLRTRSNEWLRRSRGHRG